MVAAASISIKQRPLYYPYRSLFCLLCFTTGSFTEKIQVKKAPTELEKELLHEIAYCWNDESRVQELIKEGVNLEVKDANGEFPLHIATQEECLSTVQLLLKHGANVDAINDHGWTSLMRISSHEFLPYSGSFHDQPPDLRVIKILLEYGADINAKNYEGATSLMLARDPEVFNFLLEHGADLNARDYEGKTGLMYAACNYNKLGLRMFIKHGANVNAKDNKGLTALDCTRKKIYDENTQYYEKNPDKEEIAVILRKHGAPRKEITEIIHDFAVDRVNEANAYILLYNNSSNIFEFLLKLLDIFFWTLPHNLVKLIEMVS